MQFEKRTCTAPEWPIRSPVSSSVFRFTKSVAFFDWGPVCLLERPKVHSPKKPGAGDRVEGQEGVVIAKFMFGDRVMEPVWDLPRTPAHLAGNKSTLKGARSPSINTESHLDSVSEPPRRPHIATPQTNAHANSRVLAVIHVLSTASLAKKIHCSWVKNACCCCCCFCTWWGRLCLQRKVLDLPHPHTAVFRAGHQLAERGDGRVIYSVATIDVFYPPPHTHTSNVMSGADSLRSDARHLSDSSMVCRTLESWAAFL